uniref:Chondroitin sulfate proteoglycan 4-like n=1 Tax=Gouania willdenowi TaxID=441366 RepID=A0A8C5H071_GOUWI
MIFSIFHEYLCCIKLKATESSDRNVLRLRFRTSSPDGMLFLAAGRTDHFLLELHAGRLQLKLNLGSGEQVLKSDRGTQLNDLAWHSVEVHHVQFNVTLTVDKNSHTSVIMPGSQRNLNILDGLYVGGSGSLDMSYFSRGLVYFRGCMEEVIFNEHDLLSSLRPYTGFKSVHEVSLGCSPQFFATEEDPISFFSSRAYISFPSLKPQHDITFQCVVHTSAKEGIILYNSAREDYFMAVEIQEGLPVAIVGKSGSKTELRSLTFINDRKWHSIKLHLSSKSLQLSVDGETVKASIALQTKVFQPKGHLFVGGVDDGTRSEGREVGLNSVSGKHIRGGSFKGCLKNIEINRVRRGLFNAIVTKDISVGCEPEKSLEPSTTVAPTSAPAALFHLVTPNTLSDMSTLGPGLNKRYGSNFVQLKHLVVPEGGRASLEAKHIKILLDFKTLGIRQSQIMFRIQEQPVRGQIRFDVDPDQEENTFSMLDLWHGRVMYIHGGSEEPDDFFFFSIFCSSRKQVPDYLKSSKLYRYNISVTPTNDAPELSLPEGNLFVILENSKKHLTADVLKATDIDTDNTDLFFSVLGNLNADAGYLEIESKPGIAVTSFSYKDLEEQKVLYVHKGIRNSRIVLRVSDGEKVSNTVVLRIMAVALEYEIANNTGLQILQGEAAIIGTQQLAVQTNAVKQVVDIRYDVIEPPQYGELQRLHSRGEWRHTDSFSQRLLEKERLRYVSTFEDIQTSNASDYFKCKVTVAATETTDILFPITVTWVNYHLLRNVMMHLDKIRKVTLTSEHLLATAKGIKISEEDLYFRVLTTPKKGKILLDSTALSKNSTFSQRNVTELQVHYELVDRPYEDTTDRFKFQLISKHAQSQNYDFQFSIKADINSVFIRNEGLSILEGESKIITKDELFAETLSTKDMFYSVINSPGHGNLARITQSNSNASFNNILTFSNQDVLEERIMYIHDDSETTQDSFSFIASTSQGFKSFIAEDEIGSKEGIFNISVKLVNDQKPVRVIDKVFHVVRNGQKIVTTEDLYYADNDSDFDNSMLIYTRHGIPLGDLVLVNDTTHRLFQFRQKDLEEKKVLLIHKGASTGRFVLFVSDGKNFVSGLLDISAQDPFLNVGNNTGLLVQKGHSVTFSNNNFSVVSNLDIRDDLEILFTLEEAPKYGGLYRSVEKVKSFTQLDLKDGLISYQHYDSKHLADSFNLTVKAKDLQLTERINVKVYLESHQRPPIVQHHNNLLVEEGKPVKIGPAKLEVSVILLYVCHSTFTQDDINNGNIQYVQVEAETVNDTFVLHVTNGVTDVSDITMAVDVIPKNIPLRVSNFTLNEGGYKALTDEVLIVTNRHFNGINFLYSLKIPPSHGHIEHSRNPGVALTSFSRRQVRYLNLIFHFLKHLPALLPAVAMVIGAEVMEGGSVVIDDLKLDASNLMSKLSTPERSSHEVWFQVTSLPQHGVIVVGERNLTKEKPNFSQFIVTKYGITYKHDNSETTRDSFVFSAWLNMKGKTAQLSQDDGDVVKERFNITVTPINDQPPLLKTKAPSLKVVQGDAATLGPENLKVEDLDNPPEDIVFSVISKPSNGYLAFDGSLNVSIAAFTQAQINNRTVYFIHDGSPSSGVFYFSVTDGHHKPIYKLFNLEVTEVTISLVNLTKLTLQQGTTSVPLTNNNLSAETNGKNVTIHFLITRPPNFGKLLMENREVSRFMQEDLRAGRLSYHMISHSSAEDSFEFTTFTSEANVTGQVLNITVSPLVKVGKGLSFPNGVPIKIDSSIINAEELANLSGSDPVIEIIAHPKYGKVVQTEPHMSMKGEPADYFTYQDVVQEKLLLELSANMSSVQELNDSIVFVLKAENVQPAIGEIYFTLVPFNPALFPTTTSPILTTSPVPQTPLRTTGNGTASPGLSTVFRSTQKPSKNQQKIKGRSRWGNSNRTSIFTTTRGKPSQTEEFPFRNTPVRVESYPQKGSNPLLVILPLLALLLLVIIFVVLVVYLRHHKQRKQNTATPQEPASPGPPSSLSYQGQTQRSATVPTVTVTPLAPARTGSPVIDRLLTPYQSSPYSTIDSNLIFTSRSGGVSAASSQIIQAATPTLQRNQYWV